MANNQNLKPFNTLPPEQLREISRRGGKASGKARREKREKIEEHKAAIWAEMEMRQDELVLLVNSVKELRQMSCKR